MTPLAELVHEACEQADQESEAFGDDDGLPAMSEAFRAALVEGLERDEGDAA